MADTYGNATEAEADRRQQAALLRALGGSDRALRRDECNAWRISGSRGYVYTWGDGETWYAGLDGRSDRQDTYARKRLSFCKPEPGSRLRLMSLPTAEQAAVIRDVLGIRKRREVSEAERERLRASSFKRKTQ